MPTRMSAGVGDHCCFFIFITMIPIDCIVANICLFAFLLRNAKLFTSIRVQCNEIQVNS